MGFFDIFNISKIKSENVNLKFQIDSVIEHNKQLEQQLNYLGYPDVTKTQQMLNSAQSQLEQQNEQLRQVNELIKQNVNENANLEKKLKTNTAKLSRIKDCAKRVNYALDNYVNSNLNTPVSENEIDYMEEVCPSITLKLNCMNIRDLQKAYRDNDRQIDNLLKQYSSRYTTKSNKSIYSLMIIALRSELQNIIYNLKYEKLDKAIEDVKSVTQKYLKIASDGNQNIVGTLTRFIGEIEYLFINSVKIEYNYYVKKEQAKQEQLAIKAQMRQEAEERKALEIEQKKIAKEEEKYTSEIAKLQDIITNTTATDELEILKARVLELQEQLSGIIIKKEEITKLHNGKAGTVYIISNLGSFGKDVFKIGMTRRLNPQDRVNELGDASVPFKFDVHSFIFSQDAVSLENKMHEILNDRRLNKVNLRKEFFNVSIDELADIVYSIDPTAEFNKTMIAEEYNQSLSATNNYTNDYIINPEFDEFDDE